MRRASGVATGQQIEGGAQPLCLIVANSFPPVHGGSCVVYDNLARHSGGRVCVLAPSLDYQTGRPFPDLAAFDAAAPYQIYRLRRLRTRILSGRPGLRVRLTLAAADLRIRATVLLAVARICRTHRIRTVCIGELVASGWLIKAARLLGLRTLVYVHGEEITLSDAYDPDRARRRAALMRAGAVIAVSRFTEAALIRLTGVAPPRISLIPNGVDLARFTPRPRRADLVARYGLEGRQVLLTVGRLCARKGMDRVIEALPGLLARFPDLVYLVVGEGALRTDLERLAASLGVADAVVLAGVVAADELADHYALADAFIMANRTLPDGDTEGFGLVFLEANACGIPVIAGSAGGSTDAVADGVNGIAIDGDSVAAITSAVGRVLAEPLLRAQLREDGLRVASQSGWQSRASRFLALCERGVHEAWPSVDGAPGAAIRDPQKGPALVPLD